MKKASKKTEETPKQPNKPEFLFQDQEIQAISILQIPDYSDIGNFNYTVVSLTIKNGEVIKTEMTEPTHKLVAMQEAKIKFMRVFSSQELSNHLEKVKQKLHERMQNSPEAMNEPLPFLEYEHAPKIEIK